MRLKITHTTEYHYDQPVSYSLQRLRLTPQTGPGQTVAAWQIAVDGAAIEAGFDDHFGNRVQLVASEGGNNRVHIIASGEVDTEDRAGVFGPHVGDTPLWLFNRETPRTRAGKLVRELARSLPEDDPLARMHALMNAINDSVSYRPGTTGTETTAEEAMKAGHGVCQDHAHIFIAAARLLDLPARYISGYLMMDGQEEQTATHAWAETHLPGLGWVGFDAANRVCPDARYVRIACGLCYADTAPVSGMRVGQAGENLSVAVVVKRQEQAQGQN